MQSFKKHGRKNRQTRLFCRARRPFSQQLKMDLYFYVFSPVSHSGISISCIFLKNLESSRYENKSQMLWYNLTLNNMVIIFLNFHEGSQITEFAFLKYISLHCVFPLTFLLGIFLSFPDHIPGHAPNRASRSGTDHLGPVGVSNYHGLAALRVCRGRRPAHRDKSA